MSCHCASCAPTISDIEAAPWRYGTSTIIQLVARVKELGLELNAAVQREFEYAAIREELEAVLEAIAVNGSEERDRLTAQEALRRVDADRASVRSGRQSAIRDRG